MELKYNNQKFEVEAVFKDKRLSGKIDGADKEFSAFKVNDNTYHFNHGANSFNAYAAEDDKHIYIFIDGKNYTFDKVFEEEKDFGSGSGITGNSESIVPPMPGSIVKIIAEQGEHIKEGDPVIIVEAMKMETTLFAGIDGIVKEINVKEGEQVDSDKVLVLIEKEEE